MKTKICIFLLAASLSVWAQGRSGGHAGGMGAGSMGSMGAAHDMGASHASTNNSSRPADIGKQSPDTILTRNTKLSSHLQSLLPQGMTAQQACSGFKNLGQCVAAIHVANNLGITFTDLKDKMIAGDSLGKSIHQLSPDVNAKAEAKKGQKQANNDLASS